MATKIKSSISNRGLIVVGYGGNDTSIMSVLTNSAIDEESFSQGVYWILRPSSSLSQKAYTFLEKVGEKGAYKIVAPSADNFLSNLAKACGEFTETPFYNSQSIMQTKVRVLQEYTIELDTHGYVEPVLSRVEKEPDHQSSAPRLTVDDFCKQFMSGKGIYVVTGSGGVGKSLFLKYVSLVLSKTTDTIPILLDLPRLKDENIEKYLQDRFVSGELHSTIVQGKAILLCDALDQCKNLEKIVEALKVFAPKFLQNGNRLLLASRIEALQDIETNNVFRLELFNQDQISHMVKVNLETHVEGQIYSPPQVQIYSSLFLGYFIKLMLSICLQLCMKHHLLSLLLSLWNVSMKKRHTPKFNVVL